MLRTTSLENYDKWVEGTLPFSSPEVKNAIETWSELWFNPDYVFGGTDAIVSTFFGDSPAPMFEDPPKCWMHRQGNFITGFFPEGAEAGLDYDFFYFPPVSDEYGKPFLVAGDMMSMFSSSRSFARVTSRTPTGTICSPNGVWMRCITGISMGSYPDEVRGVILGRGLLNARDARHVRSHAPNSLIVALSPSPVSPS